MQSFLISHRSFSEASGNKSSFPSVLEHVGHNHGNKRRDETQEGEESMNFSGTDINEQCQVNW